MHETIATPSLPPFTGMHALYSGSMCIRVFVWVCLCVCPALVLKGVDQGTLRSQLVARTGPKGRNQCHCCSAVAMQPAVAAGGMRFAPAEVFPSAICMSPFVGLDAIPHRLLDRSAF